jgi:serine/threonine-protein kinase
VIDFGIAKGLNSIKERGQNLTNAGEILGSPTYMSPEQCMGTPLDWRSDIYSLGCAMYEALTGDVPFLGAVAMETMKMHLDAIPAPMLCVPRELERIVLKAMEKHPDDRYQSMAELKDDLAALVAVPV